MYKFKLKITDKTIKRAYSTKKYKQLTATYFEKFIIHVKLQQNSSPTAAECRVCRSVLLLLICVYVYVCTLKTSCVKIELSNRFCYLICSWKLKREFNFNECDVGTYLLFFFCSVIYSN